MKKAFLFIAAAMAIFAGCKKEQPVQALKSDNIIHIGVKQIAPPTKVAADDITADKLSFNWEEGDQVCFINTNNSNIIYYTCTNPETGEFSGEALNPEATYEVHYPASFAESDVFSGIYRGNQIPKAHHIANWSVSGSATTITLDEHDPIIHFKLEGDAKIGKIYLSNAQDGQPIYTLSCGDEGVQLSDEPIDFYMDAQYLDKNRLSGYAYTLSIRDTQDAELKSVSFHLTATNLGTMVDFSTPIEVNASSLPEGALSGVFSVSATKQVHFSQGNLTYNVSTTTWAFYEHQYDCATGYDSKLISLFTWGYDATKSIVPDGTNYVEGHTTNGEPFSNTEDWGYVFGGESSVWRTLSKDDWTYLFNTRTMTNGKDRYSNALTGVTIGGVTYKGIFLYPDNYNGEVVSNSMTWDAINAAGIVFLPAAGCRYGSDVFDVDVTGLYWSSTAYRSGDAYNVRFSGSTVTPGYDDYRDNGSSVRLVTEVK